MERHSGEGGAPSVLKPLALTYHFGWATSTPDGRRPSEITERRPQPAVKNKVAERDGADNSISDASFEDGRGVHSTKRNGADRNIFAASLAYTTLSIRPTRGCTKETTVNGI